MTARKSNRYSTITLDSDGCLVPWLAAQGPLAYTPEAPPARDSLFQYGWVLTQVCRPGVRHHLYFGAPSRERASELFAFWKNARRHRADRVALEYGGLVNGRVEAPIAVYRHRTRLADNQYIFIQHGSYQCVPVEEQPDLEAGYVLLHRAIGEEKAFRFPAPLLLTGEQPVRTASGECFKLQRKGRPCWARCMKRADAIKSLTECAAELRTRFGVSDLSLFGSVARDEARDDSDVDVMVSFVSTPSFTSFRPVRRSEPPARHRLARLRSHRSWHRSSYRGAALRRLRRRR
jgi:hypothetical protein